MQFPPPEDTICKIATPLNRISHFPSVGAICKLHCSHCNSLWSPFPFDKFENKGSTSIWFNLVLSLSKIWVRGWSWWAGSDPRITASPLQFPFYLRWDFPLQRAIAFIVLWFLLVRNSENIPILVLVNGMEKEIGVDKPRFWVKGAAFYPFEHPISSIYSSMQF